MSREEALDIACNFSGPWTKRLLDALISREMRVRWLESILGDLDAILDFGTPFHEGMFGIVDTNKANQVMETARLALNSKGEKG